MDRAFDTIIGYENIKQELRQILDQLVDPGKYAALGVERPHGLLLEGDPGVGKSTLAQCFLRACGAKSYVLRKDRPDGEFVNEITRIFKEAADNAPSVILLDDLDKFANEDRGHRDAEEYVTVQTCIDRVKAQDVFVVATVNNTTKLPESLTRPGRFDHQLELHLPDGENAVRIVDYYLSKKSYVTQVDTRCVARLLQQRSCAELEAVVNQACAYAAFEGQQQVQMEHMIRAILRIFYKAPERCTLSDKELKDVACHEAGHALVSELLEPKSVELVSITARQSNTAGVTATYRHEDYFRSYRLMENRVMTLLAGRAATEVLYGTVDVGAGSDLKRAFAIVNRLVKDFCALGFEQHGDRDDSEATKARRDSRIAMELDRYYRQAKQLLVENRDKLEALIKLLLQEQTILGKDLRELLQAV